MTSPENYRVVRYHEKTHLEGCAESLRSGFHHNFWPFWDKARPQLAVDVVGAMGALCDLNFVVEDSSTGIAYGQVFCAAPMTGASFRRAALPGAAILAKSLSMAYLFRLKAWQHAFAVLPPYGKFLVRHNKHDPHYEIVLFVLHQKLQGKGWGRRLMDECVREVANRGARDLVLLTDSTMSWRFYEGYGYKRTLTCDLGGAYRYATGSKSEQGYEYELDVPGKMALLSRPSPP